MATTLTSTPGRSRFAALMRNKVVIGAVGVVAVGAAVTGTLSVFTATATRSQQITAGTFAFNLVDNATGTFTTAIVGMAPGDTADRTVNSQNPAGGLNYASIGVTASAAPSSLLNSDPAVGLQVTISLCSIAWTQVATTGPATCTGTTTVITPTQALSAMITAGPTYTTASTPLMTSLTSGGLDHIMFHYLLPATDTNSVAGLTSTILYTFTATQAAGTTH